MSDYPGAYSGAVLLQRRKTGAYLMFGFMVVWIVSMLGIEMSIGVHKGFGTGFGDGGHVPADIVAAAGVGPNVAAVVAATSGHTPNPSILEDIGRIAISFAILLGIIYFWYAVISRIGVF